MPGTRLHLLQEFALESQEMRVELSRGMQRLVAFLALKGPVHRSVAAGTLWPEVPEAQALASLRTSIWRINRKLPGGIAVDGVSIATRGMWIDSLQQELIAKQLLRQQITDPAWIAERLEILCLGDLLPGWYDDWVVYERERLAQLRLHALEHAAVVMARCGQPGAAIQFALEAVRAEPLRETANAALIEVYLAEGNISDAIHHYRTFRRTLQRELGVEPSPAIRALVPSSTAAWPARVGGAAYSLTDARPHLVQLGEEGER